MSQTAPSPRMRHGITSLTRSDARFYDALDLAHLLSRPAPECPHVQQAAMELADAILHLCDVTRAQMSLLSSAVPPEVEDPPPDHAITEGDALAASLARLTRQARSLRTLAVYARKARSRRDRLLTRLDHLILEARRREAEEQARIRALSCKFGPFD